MSDTDAESGRDTIANASAGIADAYADTSAGIADADS